MFKRRIRSRSALVSECGTYCYTLDRIWSDEPMLTIIMLNPPTADALKDDATIRRCISFARREQAGGIHVVNLFAFRATAPSDMASAPDPVGPNNRGHISRALLRARNEGMPVLCGWGAAPYGVEVRQSIREEAHQLGVDLVCLGLTKAKQPRHPLYVPSAQPFEPLPYTEQGDAKW